MSAVGASKQAPKIEEYIGFYELDRLELRTDATAGGPDGGLRVPL